MGYFCCWGKVKKAVMGSTHIDYKLLFSQNGSIQTLLYSLEFVLDGRVGGW